MFVFTMIERADPEKRHSVLFEKALTEDDVLKLHQDYPPDDYEYTIQVVK
jgi:hypothetical protein